MTHLDAGLLLLGLVVGLSIAAHGCQKAFGWFGGPGMRGWTAAVATMGFHPPAPYAWAAALSELVGGLGLALGLLTPVAAGIVLAHLVVIVFHVHWPNGFWNSARGIEFPVLIAAVTVFLGLVGRGMVSLDGLLVSRLLTAHGGLDAVRLVEPSLTTRIALLLAGTVAGSLALMVPRLSKARRDAHGATPDARR